MKVPFSPYFLQQVEAGQGQVDLLQGRHDPGHVQEQGQRYPPNDKKATPTTLFSTEVPTFWDNDDADERCCRRRASRSTPRTRTRARRCSPRSCSASARRCCSSGCSSCSRGAPPRGGGLGALGNFGRSQARRVDPEKIRVTFDDVAGIDEAKAELAEIVDFLRDARPVRAAGRPDARTACCCTGRPAPARRCSRAPSRARRTRRSSRSRPRSSSRRSSASAPRACATCSPRPRRPRRRSSSSTSSTRSAARARGRPASPAPTTSASRRSTRS